MSHQVVPPVIGALPAKHYEIAHGLVTRSGLRLSLVVVVTAALCLSAGYGAAVWNGRGSQLISLDTAIATMWDARAPLNRRESALGRTHILVSKGLADAARGIEAMRAAEARDPGLRQAAENYLRILRGRYPYHFAAPPTNHESK